MVSLIKDIDNELLPVNILDRLTHTKPYASYAYYMCRQMGTAVVMYYCRIENSPNS